MADKILLGILQVFAILNCYFGIKYLSSFDYSWFIYVYDVLWFFLGFISSLMGLTGMSKSWVEAGVCVLLYNWHALHFSTWRSLVHFFLFWWKNIYLPSSSSSSIFKSFWRARQKNSVDNAVPLPLCLVSYCRRLPLYCHSLVDGLSSDSNCSRNFLQFSWLFWNFFGWHVMSCVHACLVYYKTKKDGSKLCMYIVFDTTWHAFPEIIVIIHIILSIL